MGPGRAGLFGLLSVAAGVCAYLSVALYIDATAHTVALGLAFYLYAVGSLLAFVMAIKTAWPAWKGWSIPASIGLMVVAFFILYMRFFLPFP